MVSVGITKASISIKTPLQNLVSTVWLVVSRKKSIVEIKTHRFIRSDVASNKQDADELMLKKSQMFIDQMGDNIFS